MRCQRAVNVREKTCELSTLCPTTAAAVLRRRNTRNTPWEKGQTMSSYDFVIVSGGSAGSVVASRLSEDPGVGVLLLEAGPADGPVAMSVPTAWPALRGSEVDWGHATVPQPGLGGRAIHYARAGCWAAPAASTQWRTSPGHTVSRACVSPLCSAVRYCPTGSA
jgi:GMC oxidoreductase